MGFIESLNKYGYKIDLNQTDTYKKIQEAVSSMESMGLKVKIKTAFDLFEYEIVYRGMLTQNNIENAYEIFLNQNYDLLDYLSYDEKRKMFNNDIVSILKDAPCFEDVESQTMIYIPYLEPFVNQRYQNDFQLMLLKQHRDYVKNFVVCKDSPAKMYGEKIYRTSFSSLINVYEDKRHICMYFDQLKTIYIFKKDTHELLNSLIICDHQCDDCIDIEDVKTIAFDIENYLYKECLELLKEKAYISGKTYKKVLKSYK